MARLREPEVQTTSGIITLTSDFGLKDAYVGAMKGVILGINPQATIVDISHEVPPQDVHEAAFTVYMVYRYFPAGTVHAVVVDPGVGGGRRAVVLQTRRGLFVAPDNGVLTYVITEEIKSSGGTVAAKDGLLTLPDGLTAIDITNTGFHMPEVSATFHGRDVFAPVAAHLSTGIDIHSAGEPAASLRVFQAATPHCIADGSLLGTIVYTDRFGNMITNIRQTDLQGFAGPKVIVHVGDRKIRGILDTYVSAQPGQVLALIGSSSHLEIAVRNGSAARLLGLSTGDRVMVRPED